MKRRCLALVVLLAVAVPAQAQWVVTDPGVIAKAISQILILYQHYQTLVATYGQMVTLVAGLPGMDRYRLSPFALVSHDVARYPSGAPLLRALNSGDHDGSLYGQVIDQLPTVRALATTLPVGSPLRVSLERGLATIEISDSIMQRGIHQVGSIRAWSPSSAAAIAALVDDVTNPRTAYHYPSATLDKLAAGDAIAREQDMAVNQLTSHQLELLLNDGLAQRAAIADTLAWHLGDRAHALDAGETGRGDLGSDISRGIGR